MSTAVQSSPYSEAQIKVWLRGLLTIAWADGNFDDDEKALIHSITDAELAPNVEFETFEPIEPTELAQVLLPKSPEAENFLRMAVMVAIADGIYSNEEDKTLIAFCQVLQLDASVLHSLQSTLHDLSASASQAASTPAPIASTAVASPLMPPPHKEGGIDPLKPTREWLDHLEVHDPRLARFICKLVPSQCPFERDVMLFGRKVVHIPPMCKLNPLYEQLVGLRFRALSYLADDCGEDVTPYI
jgi:tellurite resistance protein